MNKLLIVAAGVVGAALGGVAGYQFALRRLVKAYDEELEREIQRTKTFYAVLNTKKQFATPADAVEAMVPEGFEALKETDEVPNEVLEKIATGLRRRYDLPGAPMVERQNVFDKTGVMEADDDPQFEDMKARRSTKQPYIITHDEFMENEPEHNQITITWYSGDKVLADDKDEPIEKVQRTVGIENLQYFGRWSNQKNVVYVRNHALTADFEIMSSEGKFAVEVLGLDPDEVE